MRDLRDEYFKKFREVQKLVIEMKHYIMANWPNVKDWSRMFLIVSSNQCERKRFSPEDMVWPTSTRVMEPKNPVSTMEVVLDDIDGDMSIRVNGEWYGWIWDETVMDLYSYIKSQNEISTD